MRHEAISRQSQNRDHRVLRDAYQRANQNEIDAKEFSGGQYTARILQKLGFEVIVR